MPLQLYSLAGRGQVHLILGPMFSGKTTELLRQLKRHSIAQHKCLLVKYAGDMRYSIDGVCTHDKQESSATACKQLSEIKHLAVDHDVVGIDEGQFFPDIVGFCEEMANEGKTVVVAALDGTFERKPFGDILSLIPLSESVVKLNAVCMKCYADAAFSKRIGAEKAVEVIGGADKYLSVCRQCYHADESAPPEATPPAGALGAKKAAASLAAMEDAKRSLFVDADGERAK